MRPTSKQLTYIRRLALSRGISFTPPTSKAEASQLIGQLKQRPRSTNAERAIDRDGLHTARRTATPASSIREDEVTGYGSNCRWSH